MGVSSAIQVPLFKIKGVPVAIVWAAPLAGLMMLVAGFMAEIFGKKKTIFIVTVAYGISLFFSLWFLLGQLLFGKKPENNVFINEHIHYFPFDALGVNWRFFLAGFLAYTLSTLTNLLIVWKYKNKDQDKKMTFRLMFASVMGQFVDNTIFSILAFAPVGISFGIEKSWLGIVYWFIANTVLELLIEWIFVYPLRYLIIRSLQRKGLYEDEDGNVIIKYEKNYSKLLKKIRKIHYQWWKNNIEYKELKNEYLINWEIIEEKLEQNTKLNELMNLIDFKYKTKLNNNNILLAINCELLEYLESKNKEELADVFIFTVLFYKKLNKEENYNIDFNEIKNETIKLESITQKNYKEYLPQLILWSSQVNEAIIKKIEYNNKREDHRKGELIE